MPLVAVWPQAIAFWAAFVWAMVPEMRLIRRTRAAPTPTAPARGGSQDAGSLQVILIGMQVALFLAFLLAFIAPRATIVAHRMLAYWAGVLLMAAASVLRRHCMRVLAGSFTGAVTVLPGQEVVERGAYRFVRHPSYTAGFLLYAGLGLALTNWMSVVLMISAPIIVYQYRARVEERALVATLGDRYLDYMRRTKRFIPFIA